jgi:hypothetical protein
MSLELIELPGKVNQHALNHADLTLIVTAHLQVDHQLVAQRARLLVDLRGVTRKLRVAGAVRLQREHMQSLSDPREGICRSGELRPRVLADARRAFWRHRLSMDPERVRWRHGAIFRQHSP